MFEYLNSFRHCGLLSNNFLLFNLCGGGRSKVKAANQLEVWQRCQSLLSCVCSSSTPTHTKPIFVVIKCKVKGGSTRYKSVVVISVLELWMMTIEFHISAALSGTSGQNTDSCRKTTGLTQIFSSCWRLIVDSNVELMSICCSYTISVSTRLTTILKNILIIILHLLLIIRCDRAVWRRS